MEYWKIKIFSPYSRFVNWADLHPQLKVQICDVPDGIFPDGLHAEIADVKVNSRGPDDVVYDNSKEIRQRVRSPASSLS